MECSTESSIGRRRCSCRNLTTKFLQIFGCTIDVAADGVEAVDKMQTGVYDICMMDVSMPNLDGESCHDPGGSYLA